jgi:aminopeptidase N
MVRPGEPESSAWWFPSNDHPSDPALMDVSARVPAGMEEISVGRLESADETFDEYASETGFWRITMIDPSRQHLSTRSTSAAR